MKKIIAAVAAIIIAASISGCDGGIGPQMPEKKKDEPKAAAGMVTPRVDESVAPSANSPAPAASPAATTATATATAAAAPPAPSPATATTTAADGCKATISSIVVEGKGANVKITCEGDKIKVTHAPQAPRTPRATQPPAPPVVHGCGARCAPQPPAQAPETLSQGKVCRLLSDGTLRLKAKPEVMYARDTVMATENGTGGQHFPRLEGESCSQWNRRFVSEFVWNG